jgi:uncharacterized iron-regulated membrane protein
VTAIRLARKVHRVVSYLVFIQVGLWVAGGLTFAALPFESVVKGGAVAAPPPRPAFPEAWAEHLAFHGADLGTLHGLAAHHSSQGLLLELQGASESRWVRMEDGSPAQRPDADQVGTYARSLYLGDGEYIGSRFLAGTEFRVLGLVDELYGRTGVWQASFDDFLGTRLYFDGDTGRFLTVRNDAWVFYDAMWRLHIMDYRGGEDFNNRLLLVFAVLAAVFVVSGAILTWNALRRALASVGRAN